MKIIASVLAAALSIAAVAAQARTPGQAQVKVPAGQPFKEALETRYVATTGKLSLFICKVYGAPPKVSTTLWVFHKAPLTQGDITFNTTAAVAEIDCAARTMKRTTVMQLHGEMFGQDQVTRQITRQAVSQAAATYPGNTIFGRAIEQACATAAPDDRKNPTFQTLSQARTFGFYMSTQ